ncbi:BTAD domain-containing putative transcriptional regulator [Crossiella cryophila]
MLGRLRVTDGDRLLDLPGGKARALLAVLLCHPNEAVSRDRLLDALWPAGPPRTAADNLRVHVSHLRRALAEPNRIVARQPGYALQVAPAELTTHRFTTLLADGRAALATDPARASHLLTSALSLWRGPAYADLDLPLLRAEAARLTELRLAALEDRIEADLALARHTQLAAELPALLAEHPLRERFHAQLMLALYHQGRQAEALATYRDLRRDLAEELGIDPSPPLRELHQRILTGDLAAPAPRHLPADLADFTGRAAELTGLLTSTAPPVCAIDGMAGIGKTSLAVHTAHRLAPHYPGAHLYLDLHGHTAGHQPAEPAAALGALLRALGIPGDRVPADLAGRAARWRHELAGQRALILLDNAASAAQVRPLLPGNPDCLVLITSRRRLVDLEAAHVLSLDVLPPADAIALFTAVAGAHRADAEPAAVAEVLRHCGHLPLAIRIAAARLRSRPAWTVEYLAQRLHAGELRELGGSVSAALTLSVQHLAPAGQRLFRLLGLHPGVTFDRYLAAAATDLSVAEAEELLEDLVDAHLLQQPRIGRYRCHDLVRDHTVRLAGQTPDQAAHTRVLDHYLHTAAAAMDVLLPHESRYRPALPAPTTPPTLTSYDQAMTWLDTERETLLAIAHAHPDRALPLSAVLWHYLHLRGHQDDALDLHTRALDQAESADEQCRSLNYLALAAIRLNRFETGLGWLHRSLALAGENSPHRGHTLHHLGLACFQLGDIPRARLYLGECLALTRESGQHYYRGHVLHRLGLACAAAGDHEEADACLEEALALARDHGYRDLEPEVRNGLGETARDRADPVRAAGHFRQALRIATETGDRDQQARAHNGLGHANRELGRPAEAARHWRLALAIYSALAVSEADLVRHHLTLLPDTAGQPPPVIHQTAPDQPI